MKKNKLILSDYASDPPKLHELRAAEVILDYFRQDVVFLRPSFHKTPDFIIQNTTWELKSSTGGKKHTMGNNLRKAKRQSSHIILDLSRCQISDERAIARAKAYLKKSPSDIQRVLAITKTHQIIEIFRRQ